MKKSAFFDNEKTASYKPSRFNVRSRSKDDKFVLYNSYYGTMLTIPPSKETQVKEALHPKVGIKDKEDPYMRNLIDGGFFVPKDTNEFKRAELLHRYDTHKSDTLHLIIMPTEDCNFRCIYCYENFARGKMELSIREGLKTFVEKKCQEIRALDVHWFGGEPLFAADVIEELTESFKASCEKHHVAYKAAMTTNGYMLDKNMFEKMIKAEVRRYQITLDGTAETHNQRRILAEGGSTFDTIFENLKEVHQTNERFSIQIRVNFDQGNYGKIPQLVDDIKLNFNSDPRYDISFHRIGQWGGPNDDQLEVCEHKEAYELFSMADEKGFQLGFLRQLLKPGASVCYAASPYSFVIGANGTIYKCTVALDDERNKVGQLHENGSMSINEEKFLLWVTSGEEADRTCQNCFYRPSCQGNACPMERIQDGVRPCPPHKVNIKKVLETLSV